MRKILFLTLMIISFTFAKENSNIANINGTWELNIKDTNSVNSYNTLTFTSLKSMLHFIMIKDSNVNIPFLSHTYKKEPLKIKIRTLRGIQSMSLNLKYISDKKLKVIVKGDYNYTLLFNKITDINATKEPKYNSLYINKNLTKFFIFKKNGEYKSLKTSYILANSTIDILMLDKDIFNDSKLKNITYSKELGQYIIKENKLYLASIDSLEIYEIDTNKLIDVKKGEILSLKESIDDEIIAKYNDKLFNYAVAKYKPKLLKLLLNRAYKISDKYKKNLLLQIGEDLRWHLRNNKYSHRYESGFGSYSVDVNDIKEVIKILVKEGVDINATVSEVVTKSYTRVDTPLSLLLSGDTSNDQIIDLLVELGIKVRNIDIYTALAQNTNNNTIKLMLKHYKFNKNDDYDVLFTAIKNKDLDIVRIIYDMGFNDTSKKDCCYELDVISYAIYFKKYKILKYILSKNTCKHSISNIKKILSHIKQENKYKKAIKILEDYIKKRKKTCTKNNKHLK